MNNIGTKTIETKRLILRKMLDTDAEYIFNNWANDVRVTKTLTWPTHQSIDITKEVLSEWLDEYTKEHTYRWGIQLKDSPELIGMIDVVNNALKDERCEVGYVLMYDKWNNGIMTEALKAVIDFLLNEVGYYMVELRHSSSNPASGRVMQKCGMKKDGQLPNRIKNIDGTRADLIYYSITK
jgi:ribosomal-protein-alanine N-acetyltransferase